MTNEEEQQPLKFGGFDDALIGLADVGHLW